MTEASVADAGWRIRVPATAANLGPGFDCFGLALRRYLWLTVVPTGVPGSWEVALDGEGADDLPRGKSNLIYRALLAGAGVSDAQAPGVRAAAVNEIPLARGQGSSAAAAVAGAAAGMLLAGNTVDRQRLIDVAMEFDGHSDNVAPAILGGAALTLERRGRVSARGVPTSEGATFVSAVPDFELETDRARSVLPVHVSFENAVYNLRAAAWMVAAWTAGDWEGVAEAMDDRLHQPFRASLVPGFGEVCAAAREAGALACCLSGSGPTVLALTTGGADHVAAAMEQAWERHGIASRADVTPMDTDGLRIDSIGSEE